MRPPSQTDAQLGVLICRIGATSASATDTEGLIYPRAGHPFDNPDADVVFRSSDHVDFHVHSIILSIASPIFAGVRLPHPAQSEDRSGWKPMVVQVKEHSTVLDRLFRLCYPVTDPSFKDLKSVRLVYEAAKRYRMGEAMSLMRTALRSFISREPLRVWAIACILELEKEAHAAADHLIKLKFPSDAIAEYREVTAGTYFRLRRYYDKGVADASYTFCTLHADEAAALPPTVPQVLTTSELGIYADYADITCRAHDGKEYAAHKVVLSMTSTLLADKIKDAERKFRKARSDDAAHTDSRPVLQFTCYGEILVRLLSLCYNPAPAWLWTISITGLFTLMVKAREYRLDRVLETVSQELRTMRLPSSPLRCYLLAAKHSFGKEKALAEKAILADPMRYGYVEEMESVTAWAYHELVEQHRAPAKSIKSASRPAPKRTSAQTLPAASKGHY